MQKSPSILFLTGLILLAFLVKAIIPAGFMPQFGESRFATIEICTTSGLIQKTVGDTQTPPSSDHDDQSASKCPYAPVLTYNGTFSTPPALPPLRVGLPPRGEPALSLVSFARPKDWFATAPPFAV